MKIAKKYIIGAIMFVAVIFTATKANSLPQCPAGAELQIFLTSCGAGLFPICMAPNPPVEVIINFMDMYESIHCGG